MSEIVNPTLPSPASASPEVESAEDRSQRERAEEIAMQQMLRSKSKQNMPIKLLPADLNSGFGPRKPRLHWHGFWPEGEEMSEPSKLAMARYLAEDLLRALTDWPHTEMRVPYAMDHERIIGIYSSYWVNERVLGARAQARVLDAIRKELGVNNEPLWYFDGLDYDPSSLRPFRKSSEESQEGKRER
ncbi:hypothetical protein BC834DRAFT_1030155 [Gloeopeniophorella convolvens]|nr:hypothetical protein BC834DRAFT_1030155 [Gloeopeniophorella convolvens]